MEHFSKFGVTIFFHHFFVCRCRVNENICNASSYRRVAWEKYWLFTFARIWWLAMRPVNSALCWKSVIPCKMELSGKDAISMLLVDLYWNMDCFRNWEDMCHVWDYTFGPEKMNINPKECKILLTEPPMNPTTNREKMIEVWERNGRKFIHFKFVAKMYIEIHENWVD